MSHLYILAIMMVGLSGCATTKITPTPDLFKGPSGWKTVKGTTKLTQTIVGETEMIAEREIELLRTGTLLEDVKSQFGVIKMKANSPIYAVSYGQSLGTYNFNTLAWCSPAPAKSNLTTFLTGQNDVECLQYVPRGGKAKIMDGGSTSKFFSRSMSTNNSSSIVPIPKIREEPVNFDRRLSLRLSTASLTGKTLLAETYFHDGEDQTVLRSQQLKYDEDGSVLWSIWGGQLRLTRTGEDDAATVSVEQVKPFRDTAVSDAQMRALLQSLIAASAKAEALEAAKDVAPDN